MMSYHSAIENSHFNGEMVGQYLNAGTKNINSGYLLSSYSYN